LTNKSEMKNIQPPRWVDRVLEWYCSDRYLEEVQGDLHEWFIKRAERQGAKRAKMMYLYDVVTYIRLFRIKNLNDMSKGNKDLLFSYLKIANRQFIKNLSYSILNTLGLTLGVLSALFISIYILDELSYDRFHKDYENIYRLINFNPSDGGLAESNPSAWKAHMDEFMPEILSHTRLGQDGVLVIDGENTALENRFYWADSNFLSFFSFEVVYGNRETMLTEPNSIVLTESKAIRYFGQSDVVGETLPIKVYDGDKDFLMKVTGVIKDVPLNSHLQFDFLSSFATTREMYGKFDSVWGLNWVRSYVKLPSNLTSLDIESKIPDFFEKYRGEGTSEYSGIRLQALSDIRLHSKNIGGNTPKGDITYIYLFGFVALLIIVAASMNYINLTTANSIRRNKEMGMRKVFGAQRKQVLKQFYVEAGFQLIFAFFIAFCLAMILLPYFNDVVGKQMLFGDIFQSNIIALMLSLYLILVVGSGFYPAVVMNRVRPIEVLKKNVSSFHGQRSVFRKAQVLVQFSIATFLISSTIVVVSQLQYFTKHDKGFDAEQLINIPVDDRSLQEKLMLIKERMSQIPSVLNITASGEALPSAMNNTWDFDWEGKSPQDNVGINIVAIDYDYLETIQGKLLLGRNLNRKLGADSAQYCLINESAFKLTGWKDLGVARVNIGGNSRLVAGVVENFNYNSLHKAVAPAVYMLIKPGQRVSPDNLIIRMEASNLPASIDQIDKVWNEFSQQPLELSFVDQSFAQMYGDEQKFMKIVVGFTLIGISLAVLGLIGLVSFIAQSKAKEISIRKVLGATRGSIIAKIGGQFIQIFVVSIIVALPISKLIMERWLENFAYRISIDWRIFLVAGLVSIVLTLVSVGSYTLKAASANPVKYLSDQ
jgi:putative ABC transport system permease protein